MFNASDRSWGTYTDIIDVHRRWIYTRHAFHLCDAVIIGGTLAELTFIRLGCKGDPLRKDAREFLDQGRLLETQLVPAEYRAVCLQGQRRTIAQYILGEFNLPPQIHVADQVAGVLLRV